MRPKYKEPEIDVNQLIIDHMSLVKRQAWHMHGRVRNVIELEDLIQIGYSGLITAAQKYTPQEGASFANYASMRIRGAMLDHLRKSSNLCRTTIQIRQRYLAAEDSLRVKLQREPEFEEIAAVLEMSVEELMKWRHAFAANIHESLDNIYDDYSIWFVSATKTPEEELDEQAIRAELKKALETLSTREALTIQLYYVEELNVYEIAEILSITTGRVSQIKKGAILKLRDWMESAHKEGRL